MYCNKDLIKNTKFFCSSAKFYNTILYLRLYPKGLRKFKRILGINIQSPKINTIIVLYNLVNNTFTSR